MSPDLPPPPANLSPQPSVEESPTNVENPDTTATVEEPAPEVNTPTSALEVNQEPQVTANALNNLNVDNPGEDDYMGPVTQVDKDFTYPTHADPMRHMTSDGIYLDDEQRKAAEIQRAKIEGRDPDLVNPPAVQGTPLMATNALKATLPGDYVVKPDVQLSVSVGVPDSALHEYGDATKARDAKQAQVDKQNEASE